MSTATDKDRDLFERIEYLLDPEQTATPELFSVGEARTLRRAQLTLHRWAEEMCNGTIQRDGEQGDGKPFRSVQVPMIQIGAYRSQDYKYNEWPIPDRERGALARVEKVCKEAGLFYWHQTDPRGCALFVAAEPLNGQNYFTKGIPCL